MNNKSSMKKLLFLVTAAIAPFTIGTAQAGAASGNPPFSVNSPQDGQLLKYNATTGFWQNYTIATGGTVTSVTGGSGSGISVTFQNTTTTPSISAITVGAITPTTVNGLTISTTSGGILTIANGKQLTVSNSLTFTGTDGTSFALPSTSDTIVTLTATQDLTNKTYNGLTLTALGTGFSAAGGTTSKTLTVTGDTTLAGAGNTLTLTGSPSLSGITATGTGTLATGTSTLTLTGNASLSGITTTGTGTFASGTSTLTLTGNATLNQAVDSTASPSFAGLTVNTHALTVNGAATLNDWFDQSVKQADSPTFVGLTLSGAVSGATTIAASGTLTIGGATQGAKLDYNTFVGGYTGLWLGAASPDATNYAVMSDGTDTLVNAPTGKYVRLRCNNGDALTATTGVVAIGATTASTSTTTGALLVGGGVGVGGAINAGSYLTLGGEASDGLTTIRAKSLTTSAANILELFDGTNQLLTATGLGDTYASFLLNEADLGTGAAGRRLYIGRNSNASPGAGFTYYGNKDGNFYAVWADGSGVLRILANDAPTNANDTAGTVVGTQTCWYTTKNVKGQTEVTPEKALVAMTSTGIYDFTYKSGAYNGERFTGPVGRDKSDWFLMDTHGKATPVFNPVTFAGYTVQAIKALDAKIHSQSSPDWPSRYLFGLAVILSAIALYRTRNRNQH